MEIGDRDERTRQKVNSFFMEQHMVLEKDN